MSLLEDVFLEDEAGEAQDLERVIEGDEFEERRRSDDDDDDENSVRGDDEAEEDKRRVDPQAPKSVRVVKNPRFVLNPARLTGPRGIQVIPDHFKDFKFKGKGHEREDLDLVLKKLEHWTYRLYPKFKFADCLKKIEALGKKRPVMVHLQKIRSDQFMSEDMVVQQDSSDDEGPKHHQEPPEEDEFDKLLQQQIDISRTMTPGPGSARKGFNTPGGDVSTPFTMPKATSSPSISDEQKERMIRNRRLAEERRLARLKQNSTETLTTNGKVDLTAISDVGNKENDVTKGFKRTPTIDASYDVDLTSNAANGHSRVDLTGVVDNCGKENDETFDPKSGPSNNGNDTVDLTNGYKENGSNQNVSDGNDIVVRDVVDLTKADGHDNTNKNVRSPSEMDDDEMNNVSNPKTIHRANVIDSSDEDCDMTAVNTTITVDIHKDNVKVSNVNRTNVFDSSDDEQDLRTVDKNAIDDNEKSVVDVDEINPDDSSIHIADNESKSNLDKNTNLKDIENIELMSVNEINNDAEIQNQGNIDRVTDDKTSAVDSDIMDVDFGDDF